MLNIRMSQLALPAFCFSLLFGCAGQLTVAKQAISVADQIFIEADYQFSVSYEKARITARENSTSWEERDRRLDPWEKARSALVSTGYALKTASIAVSIAEEGVTPTDWRKRLDEAIKGVDSLFLTLDRIGVKLPASLRAKIDAIKALLQK